MIELLTVLGIGGAAVAVLLIGHERGRHASDVIHEAVAWQTERERADDRIFMTAEQARGEFVESQIVNLTHNYRHAQKMAARPVPHLAVAR